MHTVELWRWRLIDPAADLTYRTRILMTEADAFSLDPHVERVERVERVEHSLERRGVPDGPHERRHTNPKLAYADPLHSG